MESSLNNLRIERLFVSERALTELSFINKEADSHNCISWGYIDSTYFLKKRSRSDLCASILWTYFTSATKGYLKAIGKRSES